MCWWRAQRRSTPPKNAIYSYLFIIEKQHRGSQSRLRGLTGPPPNTHTTHTEEAMTKDRACVHTESECKEWISICVCVRARVRTRACVCVRVMHGSGNSPCVFQCVLSKVQIRDCNHINGGRHQVQSVFVCFYHFIFDFSLREGSGLGYSLSQVLLVYVMCAECQHGQKVWLWGMKISLWSWWTHNLLASILDQQPAKIQGSSGVSDIFNIGFDACFTKFTTWINGGVDGGWGGLQV